MKKNYQLLAILGYILLFCSFVNAQEMSSLWGLTYAGGKYNGGTIFSTDSSGNLQKVAYSFVIVNEGSSPYFSSFCSSSDGLLYALTSMGGVHNQGVLFAYDPKLFTYTKKIDFQDSLMGSFPKGSLIQASNGNLYGMTYQGGANGLGTIFEFNPQTDSIYKKIDFNGKNNGANPYGSLLQATDGKLYGMTYQGGKNGFGVIFSLNPDSSAVEVKFNFDGSNKGSFPYGSLIQSESGKLYGMTYSGGTDNKGVLFEYNILKDTLINKISFDGSNHGSNPYGSLMQAANGKLYGMTSGGGIYSVGALFEYDTLTSVLTKMADFNATNGASPEGSLIQATNGKLYGQTSVGGMNSTSGVLFEFDTVNNKLTKVYDFNLPKTGTGPNTMIQYTDGKLYGLTFAGGVANAGVLFSFNPSDSVFNINLDLNIAPNGINPKGSLLFANNGLLYGLTSLGGVNNKGVLFTYNPSDSTFGKIYDFDSITGSFPNGSLIQATNGLLYGLTLQGGSNNLGVLFQFNPANNTLLKQVDFDDINLGSYPVGSLLQASDGNLYGMTSSGGANEFGVLYQYSTTNNSMTNEFNFDNVNGSDPLGSIIEPIPGQLYALTREGGNYNYGILFNYSITSNQVFKQYDFTNTNSNGVNPEGNLMFSSMSGNLYGLTFAGGLNDQGTMFEYNLSDDSVTKIIDLKILSGAYPESNLMQTYDGAIYGLCSSGGTNNDGMLFQYYPSDDAFFSILSFNQTNGAYPFYTAMTQVCDSPFIFVEPFNTEVKPGTTAIFSTIAYGNSLSYLWEVNTGSGFVPATDNEVYMGDTTSVLSVKKVSGSMSSYTFRCLINSLCPVALLMTNTVTLTVSSALKEQSIHQMEVYPNPASGIVTFNDFDGKLPELVTFYNNTGSQVCQLKPCSIPFQYDISNLPDGIYFIKVIYAEGSEELKIIKQ